MEMFFNRPIKGHLPNQFVRESAIKQSDRKRITDKFKAVLRKGKYNPDYFKEGDQVRVRSPKGAWDIHGKVIAQRSTENGDGGLYLIKTETGKTLIRHGTFLHHKTNKKEKEKEKEKKEQNQEA